MSLMRDEKEGERKRGNYTYFVYLQDAFKQLNSHVTTQIRIDEIKHLKICGTNSMGHSSGRHF